MKTSKYFRSQVLAKYETLLIVRMENYKKYSAAQMFDWIARPPQEL